MPQIEIAFVVPYFLLLEDGEYPTGLDGKNYLLLLKAVDTAGDEAFPKRTQVSSRFEGTAVLESDIQRLKFSQIEKLLQQTNRLLRWYRVTTGQAEVTELARAQASPYHFRIVKEEQNTSPIWTEPIIFEASPLPLGSGQTMQGVTQAVRTGLSGKNDPEVSGLFLLDAEQSLREGRFRETVLFCWSAIDSTFSQKYKTLVDSAIAGADERESFINFRNASMRYRMSAGLYFCTGFSLYEQPDELWVKLFGSYSKRNKIIHDGDSAQETDAELALLVARQVIKFLATLQPKPQNNGSKTTS